MSCHGENLNEGMGGSLVEGEWNYIGGDLSFLDYVKNGHEVSGMPAFGEALSDAEIRSLQILIREARQMHTREKKPPVRVSDGVYQSEHYKFRLETVVDGLDLPWSQAFLPDGGILITERGGSLRLFRDGVLGEPVSGTPEVWAHGQGGLLEVALHPNYAENGWVYLGFSEKGGTRNGRAQGTTKIVRGRIEDNRWTDEAVIFEVPFKYHRASGVHFGTRFVFRDGYLFFSIGDRGARQMAQDLGTPNGKIHRIHDDGRVPRDNPFADNPDAYPTIWTYGNRNPQGLDAHPRTAAIWESEHGPRGGDEINLIERGLNYGWPEITHGMHYSGRPITEKTSAPGMEQPEHYWTPSIAVCGIDFYEGDVFPEWRNDLLVGGLASNELHRLVIEDGEVTRDEILINDAGRVRDVASGPDGHPYVLLNGPGALVRLVPAD